MIQAVIHRKTAMEKKKAVLERAWLSFFSKVKFWQNTSFIRKIWYNER